MQMAYIYNYCINFAAYILNTFTYSVIKRTPEELHIPSFKKNCVKNFVMAF